jgi:hypothetical protein
MVYNTNQRPPTPHSPTATATVCIYCTINLGRGEVREKVEGQQYTRGVENTNMTDCISSL